MDTAINLTSVFITDGVGVLILMIILMTRGWNLPYRKHESTALCIMISASVINCLMDAFMSYCDGRPGKLCHAILLAGNTYLFLYSLVVGLGVIFLAVSHIERKVVRLQKIFFAVIAFVEISLLLFNFIEPLVFKIGDDNVYERGPFYFIFILSGFLLIFYGYAYYFIAKIKNPSLRYFPVFEFLLPILLAVIVQSQLYGISLQPVGFAIAFAGIVIALQNECIYIDKLTGAYNRYEFEKILTIIRDKRKYSFAAFMLDLNGFKAINDTYSHDEGDKALVDFANILMEVAKPDGVVIRFAGDEFIILILKPKDIDIEAFKKKFLAAVDAHNEASDKPYKLSAAIGGKMFEYNGESTSELMTQIDNLMYEDKEEFYKAHDRRRT